MKWSDLGISKKIGVSMGALLVVFCAMSAIFLASITTLSRANKMLQTVEETSAIMLLREIDHLKWISPLQRYAYDESLREIGIQEDHKRCNLGKWLYGQARKDAERLFPEIAPKVKAMEGPHEALHSSVAPVRNFRQEGRDTEARRYFETVAQPNMKAVQANLKEVIDLMAVEKERAQREFAATTSRARTTTMISAALGVLLALGMALLISKSVTRPTVRLAAYADRVAGGDYDAKISLRRGDELGRLAASLGRMVENMVSALRTADQRAEEAAEQSRKAEEALQATEAARREAAEATRKGMYEAASRLEGIVMETVHACAVLAESVARARASAETQKAHASETATAMTQMSAAVLEVARSASSASDHAVETRRNAEQGAGIVAETMAAIGDVHSKTADMARSMSELGEQADGIGQVMNVITDIADQTNLLALNAAIEAARAGEAGRGFAVVADEVRKLAEKTMLATKEVSDVIRAVQQSAADNIRAVEGTAGLANESNELCRSAGEALARIVEISDNTAAQVQSIAAASEEESATAEQINRSTSEVDRLAEENLASMAQADKAVEDLSTLAEHLRGLVEELKAA